MMRIVSAERLNQGTALARGALPCRPGSSSAETSQAMPGIENPLRGLDRQHSTW
ncbi:MAG: hypothetical protein ACR2MO_10570 [Acidimicrobiales bacterium]